MITKFEVDLCIVLNKNCLWRPCLLTDRDEKSNLYRGPSIDVLFWIYAPSPKKNPRFLFNNFSSTYVNHLNFFSQWFFSSPCQRQCELLPFQLICLRGTYAIEWKPKKFVFFLSHQGRKLLNWKRGKVENWTWPAFNDPWLCIQIWNDLLKGNLSYWTTHSY
jgi:hypothetical protein